MLSLVKDCSSSPASYPSDLLLHRKHIEQLDTMRAKHNGKEIPREDDPEEIAPGSLRRNHSIDASVYLGPSHISSPSVERELSHLRSPIDRGIHENLLSEMHGNWSRHWPNLMMDDPLMPEKSKLLRKILQDKERRDKLSNNNTIDVNTGCDMHEAYNRILAHSTTYLDTRSCHDSESGLRDMSGDDTDSNSDKTINGELEENQDFKDDELGNDNDHVSEKSADQKEAKKARVENIITSIQPPYSQGDEEGAEIVRPKRKRYHPQQHDAKKLEHSDAKFRCIEKSALRDQLQQLQSQLQVVQRRYMELYDEDNKAADKNRTDHGDGRQIFPLKKSSSKSSSRYEHENDILDKSDLDPSHFIKKANKLVLEQEMFAQNSSLPLQSTELDNLASSLKTEINDAVESVINTVVSRILRSHSVKVPTVETLNQNQEAEKPVSVQSPTNLAAVPTMPAPETEKLRFEKHEKISAFEPIHKNHFDIHRMHAHRHPSFPHLPYYLPTQVLPPTMYTPEPEQTEALPLIVSTPKKKRTKVTDTRLSPRAARALLQESSSIMNQNEVERPMIYSPIIPPMLPTPVAIPNPSLHHLDMMNYYREQKYEERCSSPKSPLMNGSSDRLSPTDSFNMSLASMSSRFQAKLSGETTTLTPMHLRKAKLMFFFVRYPSSAILKIYFPDIKFNKNNTAQLVKWFSNFREFFYIQMEKYARQAIAKGCKHPEELVVSTDSELYRVLNLHYNRNNQLEVPENFRLVNQSTLREFFKSLKAGKDGEQSWKKAIYKIIARMDHPLPEFFKESNWMELMGD